MPGIELEFGGLQIIFCRLSFVVRSSYRYNVVFFLVLLVSSPRLWLFFPSHLVSFSSYKFLRIRIFLAFIQIKQYITSRVK